MKKTLALLTALLVIVALSACKAQTNDPIQQDPSAPSESQTPDTQNPTESQTPSTQTPQSSAEPDTQTPNANTDNPSAELISKERAIELALQTAGVDKASAFDIEAELDYERGGKFWEVDFETREHEYSYDINAYDGTVSRVERERND